MRSQIGIIGAGAIGQAFARHFLRAGCRVVISNSRGPAPRSSLVNELGSGVHAGTVREAASAEIVVLAMPWKYLEQALGDLPAWEGRVVVDATNPIITPGFTVAELGGRSSSEIVAGLVPGARVVKAGNTLPPDVLASDPRVGEGHRVIFISGDDVRAKTEVGRILEQAGFAAVDLGGLVSGGRMQQFPGGPLAGLKLVKLA